MADPVRPAGWMVRFWFVDQDLFEVDPVRYQHALGEIGLTAYRQTVAAREHEDTFALQYARERLAVLDGDTDRIVALLGGDLTRPHQFAQVAEAMAELGRDKDVLVWCERGIAETQGWQTPRAVRPGVRDARQVWAAARGASPAPLPSMNGCPHSRAITPSDGRPRRSTPGRSNTTPPAPPCANPQARSKRRDGRRRPPGVQPTDRHTPRTTSPAPDPNHDARQCRPALSPSRRPRGTKLPGQSSLAAPRHFERAGAQTGRRSLPLHASS